MNTSRALLASLLAFTATARAATFTVTNVDDSGPGSLRQAIADAAIAPGADTVDFAPALNGQTLLLTGQIAMDMSNVADVTVDASSLANGIILSGGGACRIFSVSKSTATHGAVTLVGLTLTGGAGVGGGVNGIGGAIYNVSATLTLERCSLTSHSTNIGGAIANNGGVLVLSRCTLSGNGANSDGGAIYNIGTGSLTAERCTFSGNSASSSGGAIYTGGTASLMQCTFAGNLSGGAIFNQSSSTLAVIHCTLSANSGGGIANSYATLTLTNSIVAGNTGAGGVDISNSGSSPFGSATVTRVGANIVQTHVNNGNQATDSGPAATTDTPLLAPLGNYGGLTQTMALLPGSPARNAASGSTITSDQRGFPIVGTPDIGAYEAGTPDSNYNAYIYENLPAGTPTPQYAATFDYDGDGVSNEGEWVMGSNAGASVAGSAVGSVSMVGLSAAGNLAIAAILRRYSGRTYVLQHSDTLTGNSWVNVPGLNPLHGEGTDTWQFPIPNDDARFYRVVVTKDD